MSRGEEQERQAVWSYCFRAQVGSSPGPGPSVTYARARFYIYNRSDVRLCTQLPLSMESQHRSPFPSVHSQIIDACVSSPTRFCLQTAESMFYSSPYQPLNINICHALIITLIIRQR